MCVKTRPLPLNCQKYRHVKITALSAYGVVLHLVQHSSRYRYKIVNRRIVDRATWNPYLVKFSLEDLFTWFLFKSTGKTFNRTKWVQSSDVSLLFFRYIAEVLSRQNRRKLYTCVCVCIAPERLKRTLEKQPDKKKIIYWFDRYDHQPVCAVRVEYNETA